MFRPVLMIKARHIAASAYAKQNSLGFLQGWIQARRLGNDDIAACVYEAHRQASEQMPDKAMAIPAHFYEGESSSGRVGAIGDGSILACLEKFFQSDFGKMLIKILEALLLALIGA